MQISNKSRTRKKNGLKPSSCTGLQLNSAPRMEGTHQVLSNNDIPISDLSWFTRYKAAKATAAAVHAAATPAPAMAVVISAASAAERHCHPQAVIPQPGCATQHGGHRLCRQFTVPPWLSKVCSSSSAASQCLSDLNLSREQGRNSGW